MNIWLRLVLATQILFSIKRREREIRFRTLMSFGLVQRCCGCGKYPYMGVPVILCTKCLHQQALCEDCQKMKFCPMCVESWIVKECVLVDGSQNDE